jgi:hypothetical protein
MRDPLELWSHARGYELEPAPFDERALADSKVDHFFVEASLLRMERHPTLAPDAARLRDTSHPANPVFGIAKYPDLAATVWRPLFAQFQTGNGDETRDTAYWLWGPPARAGSSLYAAAAAMGRGPIRRALTRVGWSREQLRRIFDQWLDAARVHAMAATRAWQVFDQPHAPVVEGRTTPKPITFQMRTEARALASDDPKLADDVATVLAWLAGRAQGCDLVSVPSTAITQGAQRHADAPGISARRGRKVWACIQPIFERKTRGHRPGTHPAEFQIKPKYFDILCIT